MSFHAKATFQLKSWDEKPYDEMEGGPKLTRATVAKSFSGDIVGDGTVEYLMIYREDGSASFVGLERVVGSIGDRQGSFVLQHSGSFEGGYRHGHMVCGSGIGHRRSSWIAGRGWFRLGARR